VCGHELSQLVCDQSDECVHRVVLSIICCKCVDARKHGGEDLLYAFVCAVHEVTCVVVHFAQWARDVDSWDSLLSQILPHRHLSKRHAKHLHPQCAEVRLAQLKQLPRELVPPAIYTVTDGTVRPLFKIPCEFSELNSSWKICSSDCVHIGVCGA